MADTITTNYHWVKPEISGSPTTWGVKLNADLDQIDNTVFTNTAAATAAINAVWPVQLTGSLNSVPIGTVFIWTSDSQIPDNYFACDGSIYNITDAPHLFTVIQNVFGGDGLTTFAVPDLQTSLAIGIGGGQSIGERLSAQADPGGDFDYLFMAFIIRFE